MAERIAIFDLDGTLVDSGPSLVSCYNYAISTHCGDQVPPVTQERLSLVAGKTHDQTLRYLAGGRRNCDAATLELLRGYYRDYYRGNPQDMPLFPGAIETLTALTDEGFELGIVTSRGRESVDDVLEARGLKPFFKVVIAYEDVTRPKPFPDGIIKAAQAFGLSPEEINEWNLHMIGDSRADISAGLSAGARTTACTFGHAGARLRRIRKQRPHHFADSFAEVRSILLGK